MEQTTSCCICGENICWGFLTDHLLKDHMIVANSKEQNLFCCDDNCNKRGIRFNYRMFKKHEEPDINKQQQIASTIDQEFYKFLHKHKHTNDFITDLYNLIETISLESDSTNLIGSIVYLEFNQEKKQNKNNVIALINESNKILEKNKIKEYGYRINIEEKLLQYLKKFKTNLPDNKLIKVVVYFDDINCNEVLSSHSSNGELTHCAIKVLSKTSHENSKLCHYLTFALEEKKYLKRDKYKQYVQTCLKILNSTTVNIGNSLYKISVFCVIGDHVMMQQIFEKKLCFGAKGRNQCRCCWINANEYKNYLKSSLVSKKLRSFHTIPNIPEFNHYLSDSFHDLSEGVRKYMLYAGVNIFLKVTKKDPIELRNSILSLASFYECENCVRSVLSSDFFTPKKKNIDINKKASYRLPVCQTRIVTRLFYEHIITFRNNADPILNDLKLLFFNLLSLMYVLEDNQKMNIIEIAYNTEKYVDNFFLSLYNVFDKSQFQMTLKFHFLFHYGDMIRKFGHPLNLTCKRFESANSRVKQNLLLSKNRLNIAYTAIQKISWSNYLACKSEELVPIMAVILLRQSWN
uniref:C2H2-type domain-containing protein n=1 Tax=Strongyloides venezuelensis TaxID=75913 RepID=A0A0K0FPN3_STRVS